jgi:8-oxo-dGTP pyrophosphatase MutT (NUDIX family)
MKLLAEIQLGEGVDVRGRTLERTAIRGVILRGTRLLMIRSALPGDYMFPGGGLEQGESHEQALRRELLEECGTHLRTCGEQIGAVVEYKFAREDEYDTFKMTSCYYACEVEDGFGAQALEDYEQDLGIEPVWVELEQAIRESRSLFDMPDRPEWLPRELFMLEYVRQNLLEHTIKIQLER